jgi:hypothetical protein
MSHLEVKELLNKMDVEKNQIRSEAMRLSWSMRGGLSYADALNLSHDERKLLGELIKENMDTTKKSGLPYF